MQFLLCAATKHIEPWIVKEMSHTLINIHQNEKGPHISAGPLCLPLIAVGKESQAQNR
jgi:hypothetical protein